METKEENKKNVLSKWLSGSGSARFLKHLSLIAILLVIIIMCVFIFYNDAEKRAKSWACHDTSFLMSADSAKAMFGRLNLAKNIAAAGPAERERLYEIFGEVRNLARTHLKMAVSFHSRYYMVVTLATMLGLLATGFLVLITKSGWTNTNSYIIATFLVLASSAAFFTGLTNLFKYKENINSNTTSYLAYRAIEYRILSYAATGTNRDNQEVDVKKFIHSIDDQVEKLLAYHLDYDPGAIPILSNC